MIVRDFNENDIDEIWELGKDVVEFETTEDIILFWPKSTLKNCVGKEDVLIKVAENDGGGLIGFMIANINDSLSKAELENVFVIPEYRGSGVSDQLLREVLKDVAARGIKNVCAMSDDAVEFLVRNGFTKGRQFYWTDLALDEEFSRGKE